MYLNRSKLKAALCCAAKADVRYYLNGVMIERTPNGDLHYISTDGHRLFAGVQYAQNVMDDRPHYGLFTLIIPRDAVERAVKGRSSMDIIELKTTGDDDWQLGDIVFRPIQGTFPNWRRVLPMIEDKEEKPAMFNWDYIRDAEKALSEWYQVKQAHGYLRQFGDETALMTGKDASAMVVIMPLRSSGYSAPVTPFKPASDIDTRATVEQLQDAYAQYLLNHPANTVWMTFEYWLLADQPSGPVSMLADIPELTEQL